MSRTLKVLIAVSVTLVLVLVIGGSTSASAEPQIVRVTLTDYQITLSQVSVMPGRAVTFIITNAGQLPHKLIVQPYMNENKSPLIESLVIGPFTTQPVQFMLEQGVYRIECEQMGHAARGMVNVIAAQSIPQQSLPLPMDFIIPLLALVIGSAYIIADTLGLRLTAK